MNRTSLFDSIPDPVKRETPEEREARHAAERQEREAYREQRRVAQQQWIQWRVNCDRNREQELREMAQATEGRLNLEPYGLDKQDAAFFKREVKHEAARRLALWEQAQTMTLSDLDVPVAEQQVEP